MKFLTILKKNKYILPIFVIVLCSFAVFSFFSGYPPGELVSRTSAHLNEYRYGLAEGQYYSWAGHVSIGAPVDPEFPFFGFAFWLNLFFDTSSALILSVLFCSLMTGISMFFLILEFVPNANAAMVGSVLFLFSGTWIRLFERGWGNIVYPIPFVILAILFFYRLVKSRGNPYFNSILTGLNMSFIMLSFGPGQPFLITGLVLFLIFITNFDFNKAFSSKRIIRIYALCFFLIFLAFISTAFFKIAAGVEYLDISKGHTSYSYEDFLWRGAESISPVNVISYIASSARNIEEMGMGLLSIGPAGLLLFLSSFISFKSKKMLKLLFYFVFVLLVVGDTFVTKIVYHLPMFKNLRVVENLLFIAAIILVILAALGYSNLEKLIRKSRFKGMFAYSAVILIVSLFFIYSAPTMNIMDNSEFMLDNEPFIEFLLEDDGEYRIHSYKNDFVDNLGVGWSTVKRGIYSSDWDLGAGYFSDYSMFTTITGRSPKMPKLRGLFNDKYIVVKEESSLEHVYWDPVPPKPIGQMNYSGLRLLKNFDAEGTFEKVELIYLNEYFLPRAYIVNKSIALVAKDIRNLIPFVINLVSRDYYDSAQAVLITLSEDNEILQKADIIIHDGTLAGYGYKNMHTFNTLDESKLEILFDSNFSAAEEVKAESYMQNKRVYNIPRKGFVVFSERYSIFPESWKATFSSEEVEIVPAYSILSAYYADGQGKLILSYKPWYYYYGIPIAAIFLIFWTCALIFLNKKRITRKKAIQKVI